MSKQVKIKVRNVGQVFGCYAVVLDAVTNSKLAETDVKPYGFNGVAYSFAESICRSNGWVIVE